MKRKIAIFAVTEKGETMADVHIGDILRNDFVSEESPLRYQVVIQHIKMQRQNTVKCLTRELRYSYYFKNDIGKGIEIVGHFDVMKTIKSAFVTALDEALKERVNR